MNKEIANIPKLICATCGCELGHRIPLCKCKDCERAGK